MGKIKNAFPNIGRYSDLLSVGQWVWERSASLLASAAGAVVIGSLAKATDWLNAWGPIAWGCFGLATFVILAWTISGAGALIAARRLRGIQALIAEKSLGAAHINPLDRSFFSKRISLFDLTTPMGEPLENKVFDECELVGPAVIVLSNSAFRHNIYHNVEFAIIASDSVKTMPNKIILVSSTITKCKIYNVIFLVPEKFRDEFERGHNQPIEWMT